MFGVQGIKINVIATCILDHWVSCADTLHNRPSKPIQITVSLSQLENELLCYKLPPPSPYHEIGCHQIHFKDYMIVCLYSLKLEFKNRPLGLFESKRITEDTFSNYILPLETSASSLYFLQEILALVNITIFIRDISEPYTTALFAKFYNAWVANRE